MSGVGARSAPTYATAQAPANYRAGVGRGAFGFTTRSDVGTAGSSLDPQFGPAPVGYVAGRGRGMGDLARSQGEAGAARQSALVPAEATQDPSEGAAGGAFDEFSGYGERLFSSGAYEEDDIEADRVYASVDQSLEGRRKRAREKQLLEKPGLALIADQFADLKRDLSSVTAEEWDSIPEVGDHSLKYKQARREERFTPLPDNVILGNSAANELARSVDVNGSGDQSVVSGLSEQRSSTLSSRLDKISDSISGQTTVDPQGYMTSLNSLKIASDAEIGDIKKARVLLQSVTTTNPRHGPGWIAAARVEEVANKMVLARKVILQGCEHCPDNEDVWLEAARLHPIDTAKAILANAVKSIPSSVKIWQYAADLEVLESRKKAVLRRALEFIPNSVQLWKAAIELESAADARIMLARAVECIPQSVEMWLALAKLETHENARKVLNMAREAIPTERATWITASKLEEAHGNTNLVPKIVKKMVSSLTQYQVAIRREDWILEAVECERSGFPVTGQAIIKNTIYIDVEEEDRKRVWADDADNCLSMEPPGIETARAILNIALEEFPTRKSLWLQLAMMIQEHGTPAQLEEVLRAGVTNCPQSEVLWLMAAKQKWLQGNVPDARAILVEAYQINQKSEDIWLAAVKLEWENSNWDLAAQLLTTARETAPSERIFLKAALFSVERGEYQSAVEICQQGSKQWPQFGKFYMLAGQVFDQNLKKPVDARNCYMAGLKVIPACIPLWLLLMRLEERIKGVVKARPTGEMARIKNPANDVIWLECIRLERRAGNDKQADTLFANAMRECPKSPILWAEALLTCPKTQQRSKAIDARRLCPDSAIVALAIARLFSGVQRIRKARKWFERAIVLDPKFGDAWVYFYVFEYVNIFRHEIVSRRSEETADDNGEGLDGVDDDDEDENKQADGETAEENSVALLDEIIRRVVDAVPNRGEMWCSVSKETKLRRLDSGVKLLTMAERVLGFPLSHKPSLV